MVQESLSKAMAWKAYWGAREEEAGEPSFIAPSGSAEPTTFLDCLSLRDCPSHCTGVRETCETVSVLPRE